MVGNMQDKIKVNFQFRVNAIMKPAKNVAIAEMVTDTWVKVRELWGYLIGDAVLDKVHVVGNPVGYFPCAKMIEEGNVLAEDR
jgi:hypothetical protein